MGPISLYLSLRVDRNREEKTIKFSQPVFIKKVFQKFFFYKVDLINTPLKKFL